MVIPAWFGCRESGTSASHQLLQFCVADAATCVVFMWRI